MSYSGNADYVINSNWFAGVRGGYFVRDAHESGVFEGTRYVFNNSTNIGMPGVPASLQRATGFSNALTNSRIDRNKQERFNVQADTTIYANFAGTHAFKGGVQMDYIAQDILSGNQGNVINLNWGQALSATLADGSVRLLRGASATACSRTSGSSPRARSATPTSACSSRTRGRSTTS